MYAQIMKTEAKKSSPTLRKLNSGTIEKISLIQRNGPPTTKERDAESVLHDRHNIPNPYFDLGGWYRTVNQERVHDLYRTADGFYGHAIQVQSEINRLLELINEGAFHDETSLMTAIEYLDRIKGDLKAGAREITFDIPKFIFKFLGGSTLSIERKDRKLFINGVQD